MATIVVNGMLTSVGGDPERLVVILHHHDARIYLGAIAGLLMLFLELPMSNVVLISFRIENAAFEWNRDRAAIVERIDSRQTH